MEKMQVNGLKLETVTSFKYLGSVITDEGSKLEILSRIAQTTAALTRLKLVWNNRSISLSSILQGTVKGERRRGRQRNSWEDNIREWTGLEFGRSQRAVENREKWRKLVAKSSVVPQRSSRLRDR